MKTKLDRRSHKITIIGNNRFVIKNKITGKSLDLVDFLGSDGKKKMYRLDTDSYYVDCKYRLKDLDKVLKKYLELDLRKRESKLSLLKSRLEFRPFEYERAYEFVKAQNNHHWTHSEIDVDSDLTQYHTEFTEAEKHGINTVLKLFTRYEIRVGNYWTDVIYHRFPKPEIQMMAQVMGAMEVEHALFYDKLNEALGLNDKEFHLSFLDDPHMKKRDEFIGEMLKKGRKGSKEDLAIALATFSFVEGVVLYSSFAFLLSFQQQSKGKLKNVAGTGLAYSVRDEGLHADAGSWLFNTFVEEYEIDRTILKKEIEKIAKESYEIEKAIIDNIFSKGSIEGITDRQLKNFVKSRINKKLKDIGMDTFEKVTYNPIAKWFYKAINSLEFSDFFNQNSSSYSNHWNFGKIQKW